MRVICPFPLFTFSMPAKRTNEKEAIEKLNKIETPKEALKTEEEEDDIEIDQKDSKGTLPVKTTK